MTQHIKWFLLYFVIAVTIGLFIRDTSIKLAICPSQLYNEPPLFTSIEPFIRLINSTCPPCDVRTFAIGALEVSRHGLSRLADLGHITYWPPGFMYLEALIIKIFGIDAPFIFILIVLLSLIFAFFFVLFRRYLLGIISKNVASLLPLLLLSLPVTRFFILQPACIVLGEGFAIVFFLTAVLLTFASFINRSIGTAVFAGLTIALSAYFRPQFEPMIICLTFMAIIIAGFFFIKQIKNQIIDENARNRLYILKTILVLLLTAHVVMLPWRIYNVNRGAGWLWVDSFALIYTSGSVDTGGHADGGDLACRLEPNYCGKPSRSGFLKAFWRHIGAWYRFKLTSLGPYWFSSLTFMAPCKPTFADILFNIINAGCVLVTFPLIWLIRRHQDSLIYFWVCSSFYSCFFVIFTFAHFETRYFYAIKIFSIFSTIMLSSIVWKLHKKIRALKI